MTAWILIRNTHNFIRAMVGGPMVVMVVDMSASEVLAVVVVPQDYG